jgi:hypothetical protein
VEECAALLAGALAAEESNAELLPVEDVDWVLAGGATGGHHD